MATNSYATQLQGAIFGQTTAVGSAAVPAVALPYTVVDGDQVITVSNAAVAGVVNLSQINVAPVNINRQLSIYNLGVGTITVTPFVGDTINGAATYVLLTGQGVRLWGQTTTDWFGSATSTPAGAATTLASARLGNVCVVDKVNGNNATATRGGLPFLTITAALAAALAGDTVWVLPGTYAESISIPVSVSVVGLDRTRCIIDRTAIGVATDIVTLANTASIANMTITGSTAAAVTLQGILFSAGSAEATSRAINCAIILTHTGNGACVGVRGAGGGGTTIDWATLADCQINITGDDGTAARLRRGIYVSGGSSSPTAVNCRALVTRSGGAAGGTFYAVESGGAAGSFITLRGGVYGYVGAAGVGRADVSQTAGNLVLDNATLLGVDSNGAGGPGPANGLGFTAPSGTNVEDYGDIGAIAASLTRFFRAGTDTAQVTERALTCESNRIAKSITARAIGAAGGAGTSFTLFKNGVATALTVSLTGGGAGEKFAATTTISVGYVAGDTYSVRVITAAGSAMSDFQIGIEWYTG